MRVADPWPKYVALSEKEWEERIEKARDMLSPCRLCPRECGADRQAGEKGTCCAGAAAEVSSYNDHHGEEPPLSGRMGSGTIFFTHCNLRCLFCQNYPISHFGNGARAGADELADMMLKLQRRGCHNINFVTPTHMMPFIMEALPIAIRKGLNVPLVYNCGGYETLEALRLLDGIVDIYLPDMKYNDDQVAEKLSKAPDYVERNREAIREMHRQVGDMVVDDEGTALRGLIVRHLVMPGGMAGSDGVLGFLAKEVSPNTAVSLMSQYFPAYQADQVKEISRRITPDEYKQAAETLIGNGLRSGFLQNKWYVLVEDE
jgi:putative pyruvate formate lyase activating enzyme